MVVHGQTAEKATPSHDSAGLGVGDGLASAVQGLDAGVAVRIAVLLQPKGMAGQGRMRCTC